MWHSGHTLVVVKSVDCVFESQTAALKLYRVEKSKKVRVSALEVVEATALAGKELKRFPKGRRAGDDEHLNFAKNVVSPTLQTILDVYKQNRKSFGVILTAAVLKTAGGL